eukprot:2819074-Rhodomonas_salina.1
MDSFSETNCLLGWRKTGIQPFTQLVYWELHVQKNKEKAVLQRATATTGLNFNLFTLKAISVVSAGDGRSRH